MTDASPFPAGRWLARLGLVRDAVRQELVARQLDEHLPPPPAEVVDVGCGQGTQAIRLARRGYEMTGLDSSAEMLEAFKTTMAGDPGIDSRIRLVHASAEHLGDVVPAASADAVLCHGVLMYVAERMPLIRVMARALRSGGVLSLLVRNGDALAMRPGMQRRWSGAVEAFGSSSYTNRMGIEARADTLNGLRTAMTSCGLTVRAWYGVRVFTDHVEDMRLPEDPAALFAAEDLAGRTDPYRHVAALLHVVGERRVGRAA